MSTAGQGMRWNRWGKRTNAKPKPRPEPRKGHERFEIEEGDGYVRAVCECGSRGILYRSGPIGVEQAEADQDRHSRGLGGRA